MNVWHVVVSAANRSVECLRTLLGKINLVGLPRPYFFIFGHIEQCSGLTPGLVFRYHSWQGLGDFMWYFKFNLHDE